MGHAVSLFVRPHSLPGYQLDCGDEKPIATAEPVIVRTRSPKKVDHASVGADDGARMTGRGWLSRASVCSVHRDHISGPNPWVA